MPRITIKTPGRTPPPVPPDEDQPDPDEPRGLLNRAGDFVSGRYANRKARKRLAPPREIAGRRG